MTFTVNRDSTTTKFVRISFHKRTEVVDTFLGYPCTPYYQIDLAGYLPLPSLYVHPYMYQSPLPPTLNQATGSFFTWASWFGGATKGLQM